MSLQREGSSIAKNCGEGGREGGRDEGGREGGMREGGREGERDEGGREGGMREGGRERGREGVRETINFMPIPSSLVWPASPPRN